MIIEQSIEQYCQDKAAKKGVEIGTATRAYIENKKKLEKQRRKVWDTCFGCYNIVMAAFNGLMEDRFVDVKPMLIPSKAVRREVEALYPQKKNQTKKAYRKYITGKLRERYPYFTPVVDEAVKNFDESFFEKWASKSLRNAETLIQEICDKAIEGTRDKMTVLFYSVKNEMDKMRLPDTEIRARVYTLYLIATALEEVHLGFMLVGLVPDWVGMSDKNDKFDLLQRMDKLTKDGGKSPYFNRDWEYVMNHAMPYWNVRYVRAINSEVCGKWTHLEGGCVTIALRAIMRRCCSTKFMEGIAYDGMMEDDNMGRELACINQLEMYRSGEVPATLIHLHCVRMMFEGKTNDEIKQFLTMDDSVVITEEKLIQILLTIEILRQIEAGNIDAEAYNKALAEAHKKGKPKDYEEGSLTLTVDTVHEFGAGLAKSLKAHQAEEEERAKEEAVKNDPVNRLREKFGNVTTQKPKKAAPIYTHPRFKAEPEPAIVEAPPMHMEVQPQEPRRNATRWTPDEERYLEKSWGKVPMDEMQKHLWRTEASIRCKACRLLRKPKNTEPKLNFE